MPQNRLTRRKPTSAALALLLLSLALAACGGSSSSTSATTATGAAAVAPGVAGNVEGQIAARFATLRACLVEGGINLPKAATGQPGALGGVAGIGAQLPKGVTRAQYEAALRKCGLAHAGTATGSQRLAGPQYRQSLTKFATCMRQNGQNVPNPNTSGNGPVFNTTRLNTKSPQFKAATVKCTPLLRAAFGAPVNG